MCKITCVPHYIIVAFSLVSRTNYFQENVVDVERKKQIHFEDIERFPNLLLYLIVIFFVIRINLILK